MDISTELQKQLLDVVEAAKKVGADIYNFAKAQAPELVKEIIQWGIAYNLFWVVMGIVGGVFLYFIFKKMLAYIKKNKDAVYDSGDINGSHAAVFGFCVVLFVIGIFTLVSFFGHATPLLKAIFAPRLYLIDYVSEVIKNMKAPTP